MVERGKAKTQIFAGGQDAANRERDSLRGEEAHQKVCMAKDLCPGFMDYFWMGHFYHKVRVPRKRYMEQEGLGEESGLLCPRSSGFGGLSLLTLAWEVGWWVHSSFSLYALRLRKVV